MVYIHMARANSTDSALEAAAGAAGPHATEAFKLLSNETRLAILVALWEAYHPHGEDKTIAFSELYDRVGAQDSGNFNYHLGKLTDHFVEETDEGYRLQEAGLKLVQAVIAGAGLQGETLPPTEVHRSCHRCGGAVELSYENEHLYHMCTECEGNIGPDSAEEVPTGTLMKQPFEPAGLAHRSPGDIFVAGSIEFLRETGLLARGVCPECSGAVEESLRICEDHSAPPGEVCPACGTRDEVRVGYVCSVCKHGASFPVEAAVHDHPVTVGFCYEHDIDQTFDTEDPEACGRLWKHLFDREHTLVSKDPVRIRVTVPGNHTALQLTLDGDLDVIGVTQEPREPSNHTT